MADRTFAKFTFFKLDPAWHRRDPDARGEDKREFLAACEDFAEDRSLRAYSTVGTRGDTDLLLLSQSPILEDVHTFHVVLSQSGLAKWMSTPHSYLAMTKRSPYSESEARPEICTSDRRYLFVYPFDKKREWYRLEPSERQRIMDDHIADRPPLPGDRHQHGILIRARRSGVRRQLRGRRPRRRSSTWFRSSAALSRARTRSGTRRSSPASRCRSPGRSTRSTARRRHAPRPSSSRASKVPASMSDRSGSAERPLRVAIVGSGPAGFYAADHLLRQEDVGGGGGRVRPPARPRSASSGRGWLPTTRRSSR